MIFLGATTRLMSGPRSTCASWITEECLTNVSGTMTYGNQGDVDAGVGVVHVLLLEGCGSKEVLAGSYVAHVAKQLLLDRGLRRPVRWRTKSSEGNPGVWATSDVQAWVHYATR